MRRASSPRGQPLLEVSGLGLGLGTAPPDLPSGLVMPGTLARSCQDLGIRLQKDTWVLYMVTLPNGDLGSTEGRKWWAQGGSG